MQSLFNDQQTEKDIRKLIDTGFVVAQLPNYGELRADLDSIVNKLNHKADRSFSFIDNLTEYELNEFKKQFFLHADILNKHLIVFLRHYFPFPFYLQKSPYLRINSPFREPDITPLHTDVMYGHSKDTITVWIPFVDCLNDEGLSILDRKQSETILIKLDKRRPISEHVLPPELNKGIKMHEGAALLFFGNCLHRSVFNPKNKTRLSIDSRIHLPGKKFSQKKFELFRKIEYGY